MNTITKSDSPYLSLKQGNVFSLAALQRAPLKMSDKIQVITHTYTIVFVKLLCEQIERNICFVSKCLKRMEIKSLSFDLSKETPNLETS